MAYNGTKLGQDSRFQNPDTKILSSMKTPKIYKTTVSKQNLIILPIIKLWLNKKINDVLEFEDETLANLIINLIKSSNEKIDPKNIQYQISGFLGDKTYSFMKQFWKLLINVQELFLKDKTIPEDLIPLQEEYEKRRQFYQSNKRKIEKNEKYYDNLNNMNNENESEEIRNKKDDNYEDYKIRDKYYRKSESSSRSTVKNKDRYKSRSRSRYRKEDRSLSKRIRDEKERYRYRSRSGHKRYSRGRSRSRSRNRSKSKSNRYRSRSRNRRINDRNESRNRDQYKYKYRKSKEKKKNYSEENHSYYTESYNSKNFKRKKIEYNHKKSRSSSSDSSSITFKLEEKSLSDSRNSDTFQNNNQQNILKYNNK